MKYHLGDYRGQERQKHYLKIKTPRPDFMTCNKPTTIFTHLLSLLAHNKSFKSEHLCKRLVSDVSLQCLSKFARSKVIQRADNRPWRSLDKPSNVVRGAAMNEEGNKRDHHGHMVVSKFPMIFKYLKSFNLKYIFTIWTWILVIQDFSSSFIVQVQVSCP